MKISSDEITSVIKKQIENYKVDLNVDEVGTVLEVGDGIAHVYGLQNCMAGELLELPNGVYGMALNLEESNVGAVLLGRSETIKEGDVVKRTGHLMQVPVGDAVIGRVVNALGQPIDGKGEIKTDEYRDIEIKAPGIADRQPVNVPLQTGLKSIDSMVPIDLKAQVADLSCEIAAKIISKNMTPDANDRLIAESIAKLDAKKAGK